MKKSENGQKRAVGLENGRLVARTVRNGVRYEMGLENDKRTGQNDKKLTKNGQKWIKGVKNG